VVGERNTGHGVLFSVNTRNGRKTTKILNHLPHNRSAFYFIGHTQNGEAANLAEPG